MLYRFLCCFIPPLLASDWTTGDRPPGLGPLARAVAADGSLRTLSHARVQALSRVEASPPVVPIPRTIAALQPRTTASPYIYHDTATDTPHLPAASLDCAVLLDNYSTASLQQNHLTGSLALRYLDPSNRLYAITNLLRINTLWQSPNSTLDQPRRWTKSAP